MERYFLGGNSCRGFVSLYDKATENVDNVIMLKGGAGTGKSSTIRHIFNTATLKDMDCELWHCSGDNRSLDGVYIKDISSVVVDATSPHSLEPKMPMIKDRIYNLAECIDKNKIKQHRYDVEKLLNDKKHSFMCAYDNLNIAFCYYKQIDREMRKLIGENKIRQFASNFANQIDAKIGCKYAQNKMTKMRFAMAITPDGIVKYYDHLNNKNVYVVCGDTLSRNVFFDELKRLVDADMLLIDPFCPDNVCGIIIDNIAVVDDACKSANNAVVDLSQFENGLQGDDYILQLKDNLKKQIDDAIIHLSNAKDSHLKMEKFYVEAMDFAHLEDIRAKICEDMFCKY